jgi:hypothetical protein
MFDLAVLGSAYGSLTGDANWNLNADLTNDGEVDIFDVSVLAEHWLAGVE